MSEINFSESLDRLKESFLWVAAQSGNTQGNLTCSKHSVYVNDLKIIYII